ncbi:HAMP domain-containing protein [Paenibacillus chitinolyticus]|uniref:histidine kinase n=1 Tax=Paenibacillus chitinolyticus TaxID=79263 RepID=A0A410WSU4_9BACL|nr:ATP-binding protein [Paenibacillus chitinolyticus]MCY9588798.1 ATP-binding protein [Paenibacillus chitinolyticus]MCY9595698.1 ATP-binding protein [Paenibacillus chitinolyticus]QAV17455.1 HAMP domain-containing protein [Paenibacillus chitinolyticus]
MKPNRSRKFGKIWGLLVRGIVRPVILCKQNVMRSLRMQLILAFALCIGVAIAAGGLVSELTKSWRTASSISYIQDKEITANQVRRLVERLEQIQKYGGDTDRYPAAKEESALKHLPSTDQELQSQKETEDTGTGIGSGPDRQADSGSSASSTAPKSAAPSPMPESAVPDGTGTNGKAAPEPAGPGAAEADSKKTPTPGKAAEQPAPSFFPVNPADIQSLLDDEADRPGRKSLYIIDAAGKVLYRTKGSGESRFDIPQLVGSAMDSEGTFRESHENREFTFMYPILLNGTQSFLVAKAVPEAQISYYEQDTSLPLIAGIATFLGLFYWITRRKMQLIEEMAQGLVQMSQGNLAHRVPERSHDELGVLAGHMNSMAFDLQHSLEEERKSQRLKNELITNVSHDLRTPLTLIIGYLRLLKDKDYKDEEQAANYMQIAYGRAEKLKILIDELFEFSRMTNEGVPLAKQSVCVNDLIYQLSEEYITIAEQNGLTLRLVLPPMRLFVSMDPDQMIRVFENLLTNAVKYSPKPSTIEVIVQEEGRDVKVTVINEGDLSETEELDRLFDRFYRMDAARSSDTGGSGLGLAIARSIVEAHDGRIWAENRGKSIMFHVKLRRY